MHTVRKMRQRMSKPHHPCDDDAGRPQGRLRDIREAERYGMYGVRKLHLHMSGQEASDSGI